MKKIIALCCFCAFTAAVLKAQVFSSSNMPCQVATGISLESMTGATTATNSSSIPSSLITFPGGFSFWFAGTNYTSISISPDGWVRLGAAGSVQGTPNFNSTTNQPIIAPYWSNLTNIQSPKYLMTGNAPYRKFVVQWLGNAPSQSSATFQLWLNEGTNRIDFVYGNVYSTSSQYSIGFGKTIASQNTFVNIASSANPLTSQVYYNSVYNLNSIAIPAGTMYSFVPVTGSVTAPANETWTYVSAGCINFSWTDSSASEAYWTIERSLDNVNYSLLKAIPSTTTPGVGSTYQFLDTNLIPQTQYYYRINSYSFCSSVNAPHTIDTTTTSPSLTGVLTIPGDYPSIYEALEGIKCERLAGPVVLELQSSYVDTGEIFPLRINQYLYTSTINTITIQPAANASGLVISDSTALLFDVSNAEGFIINGSPDGNGVSNELTLENLLGFSLVLRYSNDASYNELLHLNINGSGMLTTSGSVTIAGTNGTSGNDYITIRKCNFSNTTTGLTSNHIYASGTVGKENDHITIDSSNFSNYCAQGTNIHSAAIQVLYGNDFWTITNCSFYEAVPVVTQGSLYAIRLLNGSALSWEVNNNSFGGTVPGASGGKSYISAKSGSVLYIRGSRQGVCNIQGNVMRNFYYNATPVTSPYCTFIQIDSANANIGTVIPNEIGRQDSTDNIIINCVTNFTTSGIAANNGVRCVAENNRIGGISILGSGSSSLVLLGLGGDTSYVRNNQLGSPTVEHSIYLTAAGRISGMGANNYGYHIIEGNHVCNITKAILNTTANDCIVGMSIDHPVTSNTGTNIVRNNTFRNFRCYNNYCPIAGIDVMNPTNTLIIEHNEFYSFVATGGTTQHLYGIQYYGNLNYSGTNRTVIDGNWIHHIYGENCPGIAVYGISATSGPGRCQIINNMVALGMRNNGTAERTSEFIYGINGVGPKCNLFFNSIYIGGQDSSQACSSTGYSCGNSSGADSAYNNIVLIDRAPGSAFNSAHCAVHTGSQLAADHNMYYIAYPQGPFSSSFSTFALWQTAGRDVNGLYALPSYMNPAGDTQTANLHLVGLSPAEGNGMVIPWIQTDIDGQLRSAYSPADIGADAGNFFFTTITEHPAPGHLMIFPNPAADLITLSFEVASHCEVTVNLYNAMGEMVSTENKGELSGKQTTAIDTGNLPDGMYIVEIIAGGTRMCTRMQISR